MSELARRYDDSALILEAKFRCKTIGEACFDELYGTLNFFYNKALRTDHLESENKQQEKIIRKLFNANYIFRGFIEGDVEIKLLNAWANSEAIGLNEAWQYYVRGSEEEFSELCKELEKPNFFVYEKGDESECFLIKDNNYVIPFSLITKCGYDYE